MNSYYKAEFPYSEELYHHGIKGQKWGIRRFQNSDGTLTTLGKIHYGSQKYARIAGSAISKGAKRVAKGTANVVSKGAKRASLNFKSRHKWLMTDEELKEYTNRLTLEANYKKALADSKKKENGRKFISDNLSKIGNALIGAGINVVTDNIRAQNQIRLDDKKRAHEKAIAKKEIKKNLSYELANKTIKDIKDEKRKPLTNDQINKRLDRISLYSELEGYTVPKTNNGKKKKK